MKDKPNDLLLLAGKVLAIIMQGALAIGGAGIFVALVAVSFWGTDIASGIEAETGAVLSDVPTAAILALLTLAILLVGAAFVFFGKLRQIIATVGEGDPFVPENATRLSHMGWLSLSMYLLLAAMTPFGFLILNWAEHTSDTDFAFTTTLDLSSVLLTIILFILARVFKHGAEMREDLEGTV